MSVDARRGGKEHFLEWTITGKKLMIPSLTRLASQSCCVPCHPLVKWKGTHAQYGMRMGGREEVWNDGGAGATLDPS